MKPRQHFTAMPKLTQTLQLLKFRNDNVTISNFLAKKVTFCADKDNVTWTFAPEDIPIEELWFTCEEFQSIKVETKNEARRWRRLECDKLLNNVFSTDDNIRDSDVSTNNQQYFINIFCAFEDTLNKRGLERLCSQKLAEERSDAKSRSKYAVLNTQKQYERKTGAGECVNFDQMSKAIAAKYEKNSEEAKQYARRMGIGDEIAVVAPISGDEVDNVLNLCRNKKQRRLSSFSASTVSSSGSSFDSRFVVINQGTTGTSLQAKNRLAPTTISRKSPWHEPKELYAAIA